MLKFLFCIYLLFCGFTIISIKVLVDNCLDELYESFSEEELKNCSKKATFVNNIFPMALIVLTPIVNIFMAFFIALNQDKLKDLVIKEFEKRINNKG